MPALAELKHTLPVSLVQTAAIPVVAEQDWASRKFASYLRYTPVLWVLGVLAPLGVLTMARLFLRKASIPRPCAVTWLWWIAGLMQGVSVVVNAIARDVTPGYMVYRLVSGPVTGWLLLGVAIAAGRRYRLNSPDMVRGVCELGASLFVLGVGTLGAALLLGLDDLSIRSPLGMLLPAEMPIVQTAFTMRFFTNEDTLGSTIPRLILFYPWSACLGFAGVAIVFIAMQERALLFKVAGILGGIVALAGSMSRAAAAAFLVAGAIYVFRRTSLRLQYAALALACIAGLASMILDFRPMDILSGMNNSVSGMRAGSTEARQMGYDESWRGFLQSPLLGQGWPGEILSEEIPMPVGTHSTIYGVLYTGGLLTFVPLCLALGWTLIALFRQSGSGTGRHRSALAIGVTLAILSYGEGIYTLVLPTLFAFCWLGAALNPIETTHA